MMSVFWNQKIMRNEAIAENAVYKRAILYRAAWLDADFLRSWTHDIYYCSCLLEWYIYEKEIIPWISINALKE